MYNIFVVVVVVLFFFLALFLNHCRIYIAIVGGFVIIYPVYDKFTQRSNGKLE